MAFRKKAKYLTEYDADIYIIQECEDLFHLELEELKLYPNRIWIGNNKHKGLAVLTKENIQLEKYEEYNENYRYILPLKVTFAGEIRFNMLAVWSQNDKVNRKNQYIGQIWLALQAYRQLLNQNTILIGDLNSNSIWDNGYPKIANHSQTVAFLAEYRIVSLYHLLNNENQGGESAKTLAFRKDMSKGYHIDYCFLSNSMIGDNTKIDILEFHDWITRSDHVPLIVDL